MSEMLVLSSNELVALLPPLQIIAAVEAALRAQVSGRVVAPRRLHVEWKGSTLLAMPAVADDTFGVKIVSVVPGNRSKEIPVTNGLMILGSSDTGVPLAIMNAGSLTAQRTGAVGALGVKYLTPDNTRSAGIVGCGVQGAWQAIFACKVRPIRELFCISRTIASFEKFSAIVNRHAPEASIVRCTSADELLSRTALVIAATTSSQPVLPDRPDLLENKHFISVGSFRPTMQELPDSVYRLAGQVAVDSEYARHEAGDIINPLNAGIIEETSLYSIGECVTGERKPDTSRTTVYKSVGAAIYDLFVAQALYYAAKSRNLGSEVDL